MSNLYSRLLWWHNNLYHHHNALDPLRPGPNIALIAGWLVIYIWRALGNNEVISREYGANLGYTKLHVWADTCVGKYSFVCVRCIQRMYLLERYYDTCEKDTILYDTKFLVFMKVVKMNLYLFTRQSANKSKMHDKQKSATWKATFQHGGLYLVGLEPDWNGEWLVRFQCRGEMESIRLRFWDGGLGFWNRLR